MSSFWPHAFATSAISRADFIEISRVRSKPKSSRCAFSASTTPSETVAPSATGSAAWIVMPESSERS